MDRKQRYPPISCRAGNMEAVQMEPRTVVDDMQDDLDVCMECAGTWKVACYGAWYPHSQFWDDFLEMDGWEDGAYSPRACCLRLICGVLFCFFAPVWCCKAIFFFLFWPCICCCRAAKEGNCNREYFRTKRARHNTSDKSQPLAYIESAKPTRPNEISYQYSLPRSIPPESPIPEIRIQTEQENGTYITSPVEDATTDTQLTAINGHRQPWAHGEQVTRVRDTEDDPPPLYPFEESPRANTSHSRSHTHTGTSSHKHPSPHSPSSSIPLSHPTASKTMSAKAKGMDNNLYRAVVMEGFQGITGKVTTV